MKRLIASFLGIILIFSLSGCISTTPQYVEKDSKELTIYTAYEEEQVAEYIEAFKEEYPDIEVNLIVDSHGVISAKVISERENPKADIVWGLSAINMIELERKGLLAPYKSINSEDVEKRFKDHNEVPYWVGLDATETAFVVNYKELEDRGMAIPESFEDLIKPEYKGLISMPNPASSGTGYFTVSALLQMYGEENGWEYMSKLHENIGVYTHSGSKPSKLAGTGEYPIGISFGYRGVVQMQSGEPVTVVFPKEGSGWDLESIALTYKTRVKDEAKLFVDWALSKGAMKLYAKNTPITTIETDTPIPDGYSDDPVGQLISNDLAWASLNREGILKQWEKNYGSKSESK